MKNLSKRTLSNWRKDALLILARIENKKSLGLTEMEVFLKESQEKILSLTQNLLDLDLIRK